MTAARACIGTDAGATHTEAVVVVGGRVEWHGTAGPMNHLAPRQAAGGWMARSEPSSATSGPGGQRGRRRPERPRHLRQGGRRGQAPRAPPGASGLPHKRPVAALWGAARGGDGMVLLCGTGSAVRARSGGRLTRVGGGGSLFSDDGSACAIGQAAVRHALNATDGIGPAMALVARLAEATGVERVEALPGNVFAEAWGSAEAAQLARVVGACAADGDPPVAVGILEGRGARSGSWPPARVARGPGPPVCLVGRGWLLSPVLWRAASGSLGERTGVRPTRLEPREIAAQAVVRWATEGGARSR